MEDFGVLWIWGFVGFPQVFRAGMVWLSGADPGICVRGPSPPNPCHVNGNRHCAIVVSCTKFEVSSVSRCGDISQGVKF